MNVLAELVHWMRPTKIRRGPTTGWWKMTGDQAMSFEQVQQWLGTLVGKECCRVGIGQYKGLTLGFGDKVYHGNEKLASPYYGEWELGSYWSPWRVVQGERIICGSRSDVKDLDRWSMVGLHGVAFCGLQMRGTMDISVLLDGARVEFFPASQDYISDEFRIVHRPLEDYVEFAPCNGWRKCKW